MGDDDEAGAGAGERGGEVLGEPGDALDVEVVGRLVEEQQVGSGDEEGGEGHPAPLSAGERADRRPQAADHRRVETAEQPGEDVADAGVGRPLVLREVAEHGLVHGGRGIEGVVLAEDPHPQAARARDPSVVDGPRSREHAQQRRLAAAVAADDPDAVAPRDPERDGVEHLRGAEGEGGALDGDQARH